MNRNGMFAVGIMIVILTFLSTVFVVDQRRFAVVYAFGEIKESIGEPGLRFKLPPPFQNVVMLDRRIQTLDAPDTRPIFTQEKKSLVIDWLVKWRIKEPIEFIRNNGVELRNLEARLSPVVQATFNEVVTQRTVQDVLNNEREAIMKEVLVRLEGTLDAFGIDIVDVRIKRVDFAPTVTDSVYRRMDSERKRAANEVRATGAAAGEKIRAEADREREVILAQAYREAQGIKGEGDARAAALYSEAFSRDPQFAHFYRSLEAYKVSFRNRSDVLVLDPNSEFFKTFRGVMPQPISR